VAGYFFESFTMIRTVVAAPKALRSVQPIGAAILLAAVYWES
jgi:hypothetical protein